LNGISINIRSEQGNDTRRKKTHRETTRITMLKN